MATVWFIEKPDVRNGVQWTGNNLAELETWLAGVFPSLLPIVDNGDGTVTCANGWVVNDTDWLTNLGLLTDAAMSEWFEKLTGGPPFSSGVVGT